MESLILSEQPSAQTPLPRLAFSIHDIPRASLLGVRFHALTLERTLDVIDQFIQDRTPRQVCLCNAYTFSLAKKDGAYNEVLNHADLLLADGMSIVWGARWVSVRLPERVAGPDLMEALCAQAVTRNHRVFLLGSSIENIEALAVALQQRSPGLTIAGIYSPPVCDKIRQPENEKILALLKESRPDILFVGMSAPKQEKWIAENLNSLQVPVCLGVGAAFDFLSGRISRAPLWMQRVGLEWLYRLSCEPRRLWRRYVLGNIIFLSLLLKELFTYKLSRLRSFRF